eukprot:gene13194-biopygen965
MGRKLLRTWEGTRGCLQSKHYAAAKRQLGELPAPELLPLGLRQGADPATIRREFKGAEFAALAEHATDLPAQPVYFNPCWEKTPRWSAPLRDSAIRLDTRLILGGPQGLSDPRSWFCEQAPPALLLRELVVIGGDLVPSSSCPDPGQIWPAALWKNRRGRWVEKGFPISILGPNDVYTPGRDGLAFMKTAPPGEPEKGKLKGGVDLSSHLEAWEPSVMGPKAGKSIQLEWFVCSGPAGGIQHLHRVTAVLAAFLCVHRGRLECGQHGGGRGGTGHTHGRTHGQCCSFECDGRTDARTHARTHGQCCSFECDGHTDGRTDARTDARTVLLI